MRFRNYKKLPKATSPWGLDSGAFSELLNNGRWTISAHKYADSVRRLNEEIGNLQWASIQDWICSPAVLKKTGLSLRLHQKKTVDNLYALRKFAPEINWLPVLQGWNVESYIEHIRMYEAHGFALDKEMLVGVGSLANRQRSEELPKILTALKTEGLNTHAFGLSITGLSKVHNMIASSDSMVWSFVARKRRIKYSKCRQDHKICNNCLVYALSWRKQILSQLLHTASQKG
jgi:hypothetical protein